MSSPVATFSGVQGFKVLLVARDPRFVSFDF